MALTCARCGTQNPDGNRFCTNCGTALVPAAAQAPVGTAVAPAPPPGPGYAPPPAYQSPYYAPAPGTAGPGVHRTPWVLIISIVVAVVLVLSGIGTVLALAGGHRTTQSSNGFSSLSSPSPVPSASPGETPQPSPSPTSQPSSGGGQAVSNDSETVNVPDGWKVENKDANSITISDPQGQGVLTIGSGPESPPQSAQQLKDQIDKQLAAKFPDAGTCQGTGTANGPIASVNGIFWTECFTATSGGQSVPIAEPLWVGANANGSVAYVVVLQTTQDNEEAFVKECVPILQAGITWKLK